MDVEKEILVLFHKKTIGIRSGIVLRSLFQSFRKGQTKKSSAFY